MTRIIFFLFALGVAAPVRADISDSGNLTIGGDGVIQGTMTVQGSAFSVGGTTFSVAGGSVTLGGRFNAAAAGIMWADGTVSTTAASGGGGATAYASTFTVLSTNFDTTAMATNECLAGSTITMTTNAMNRILIRTVGFHLSNTATNYGSLVMLLIDGAFTDGLGATLTSAMVAQAGGVDNVVPANFAFKTKDTVAAGSHSACLILRRAGVGGTARLACGTWGPCRLRMEEAP